MKLFKLLFGVAVLTAPALPLNAQEVSSKKVDDLETKVTAMDKIVSKLPSISGFINTQYTYDDSGTNTFSIRRARLDVKGSASKYVEYRLQLEFTSPKIVDAFIKLKPSPYFNVQIGQFKVPFSLENPIAPLALEAIDNAQVISKLSGFSDVSGVSAMGRDIGLSIYGGFGKQDGYNLVDYNIGVFNGNGVNTKDNNTNKDIAGRLEIHPIKAITLAGSFYNGRMNGASSDDIVAKNRYAISLRYDDTKFLFRAEYLRGKTNKLQSEGYYGIVGYHINSKVCPVLRYDYYRNDINVENNRSTYYMAGIDYWPWKFMRVQVNYTIKDLQAKDKLGNQIGAMVSIKF